MTQVALVHTPFLGLDQRDSRSPFMALEPTMPPIGIAALAAYLKENGIDVDTYDLNLEFSSSICMPSIETRYRDVIDKMRTPAGLDFGVAAEYYFLKFINDGFLRLQLFRLQAAFSMQRWDQVQDNLLVRFLIPYLQTLSAYDAVGFSAVFDQQCPLAAVMALLLRRLFPKTKILFGGSGFKKAQVFAGMPVSEMADQVILGDGEEALLRYLRRHFAGEEVVKDDSIPTETHVQRLDDLPRPDYDQLFERHQYIAPHRMIPLAITRGCYWRKCLFCEYGWTGIDGDKCTATYRKMSPKRIVSDIESYQERLGVDRYYFSTDATDPKLVRALAEELIERSIKVCWRTQIRFEPEFADKGFLKLLKQSGCHSLTGGMEAKSQRVMDAMRKGIRSENVENFVEAAIEIGIHPSVHAFYGFPTETPEESAETWRFVCGNGSRIPVTVPNKFMYLANAPLAELTRRGEMPGLELVADEASPKKTSGMDWEALNQQFLLLSTGILTDPTQLMIPMRYYGPLAFDYYSSVGIPKVVEMLRSNENIMLRCVVGQYGFGQTITYLSFLSEQFDLSSFYAECAKAKLRMKNWIAFGRDEVLDFIYILIKAYINSYNLDDDKRKVCLEIARFEYHQAQAAIRALECGISALPTTPDGRLQKSEKMPTVGPITFSYDVCKAFAMRPVEEFFETPGPFSFLFRADGFEMIRQE